MQGWRGSAIAIVMLSSCGSPVQRPERAQETTLQLVVAEDPLVVQTSTTLTVRLLVIGEGADEAKISSPDLPPFATLHGSMLTLSPGREYQGDYALTLVAAAGSNSTSARLQVSVIRFNTAPTLGYNLLGDSNGIYLRMNMTDPSCNTVKCTLHGTPSVSIMLADADRDSVTVEVEVVPAGQPFSGYPTHRVTAPVGVDAAERCQSAGDPFHACIEVKLTGLADGQSYVYAMRVRDALGAIGLWERFGSRQPTDGWLANPDPFLLEP
jgi:hypothetical protein